MDKGGSVFGGTLLVSGTCIGAGMLALPILTGLTGFFPSLLVYIFCWLIMCTTGLLFLELCLWLDRGTNIVSMAAVTLGKGGKWVAWVVYLYLFYSLTVAYVSGGGQVVVDLLDDALPVWLATLIFAVIFSPFVYYGATAVDKTNLVLVAGLCLSYLAFVFYGVEHVDFSLLTHVDWSKMLFALPVIVTSFGFQGLVPSLTDYLRRDPAKVRLAIIIGSFIPFAVYTLWELLILGIVPIEGEYGLLHAFATGTTAIKPLRHLIESPVIFALGEFFAFFALTSSFLGVSLGLRDFLADGLRVKKNRSGRALLCLAIFVPALVISWTDPRLFLLALHYGGGLGVALLLGLLPVLMVWSGRYRLNMSGPYRFGGGKPALLLLGLCFVLVLIAEILY